jgi:predicted nucleotidyltransferase
MNCHNGHMTELAILAADVEASERTLRRAVNQGTLRAGRPRPRKLEISTAERQYIRRFWPLLAELRAVLRTEQNVRFALLFGSAARGDVAPGSDVDLLVEMRETSLGRIVDLGAKLEAQLGRRVDIVTREEAEGSPHLLADAATDGRVLVDREARWPGLRDEAASLRQRARRREQRRTREALDGIDRLLAG